jgi:hypothetical protein
VSKTATITIIRAATKGFAVPTYIEDGSTPIAALGDGGKVTWRREPGYAALVTSSMAAMIFPVEAGKTYTLEVKFNGFWGWYLEPLDFKKNLIIGEWRTSDRYFGLTNAWKDKYMNLPGVRVQPVTHNIYYEGASGYQAIKADAASGVCKVGFSYDEEKLREMAYEGKDVWVNVGGGMDCGLKGDYFFYYACKSTEGLTCTLLSMEPDVRVFALLSRHALLEHHLADYPSKVRLGDMKFTSNKWREIFASQPTGEEFCGLSPGTPTYLEPAILNPGLLLSISYESYHRINAYGSYKPPIEEKAEEVFLEYK